MYEVSSTWVVARNYEFEKQLINTRIVYIDFKKSNVWLSLYTMPQICFQSVTVFVTVLAVIYESFVS